MAERDDVFIGRRLLKEGRISGEELLECLFRIAEQRRDGRVIVQPLGVLLLHQGRLSRGELNELLKERVRAPGGPLSVSQAADLEIGDLLVAAGAAAAEHVNECLRLQRETKNPGARSTRLWDLLMERGYATRAQIARALEYQGRKKYECPACGARFNVLGAEEERAYVCRSCGWQLAAAAPKAPSPAARKLPATEIVAAHHMPELPPEAQVSVDRAVRLFLKHRNVVRPELLREAERFQMELSRYGLWVPLLDVVMRFGGLSWQQMGALQQQDFQAIVRSEAWKKQSVPGYRITGKIAAGAFAAVFAAEAIFGKKRVALKILHADHARNPDSIARLKREAELLIALRHPGIVRGLEFVEEGPARFIVMELVDGDTLDRIVAETSGLPPQEALSIALQTAEALKYLAAEGYTHRDVKPQNIIVSADGRAKLCDLGFADEIRPLETGRSALAAGTPHYMSPEQAQGRLDLKVGTDIYALGLTLYFMLTARNAFAQKDSDEVVTERFLSGVAAPDVEAMQAPAPVAALIRKMTHPDREARFGTYPELIAAMKRAAALP